VPHRILILKMPGAETSNFRTFLMFSARVGSLRNTTIISRNDLVYIKQLPFLSRLRG
jgi:hypothetical protein